MGSGEVVVFYSISQDNLLRRVNQLPSIGLIGCGSTDKDGILDLNSLVFVVDITVRGYDSLSVVQVFKNDQRAPKESACIEFELDNHRAVLALRREHFFSSDRLPCCGLHRFARGLIHQGANDLIRMSNNETFVGNGIRQDNLAGGLKYLRAVSSIFSAGLDGRFYHGHSLVSILNILVRRHRRLVTSSKEQFLEHHDIASLHGRSVESDSRNSRASSAFRRELHLRNDGYAVIQNRLAGSLINQAASQCVGVSSRQVTIYHGIIDGRSFRGINELTSIHRAQSNSPHDFRVVNRSSLLLIIDILMGRNDSSVEE